MSSYSVKPVDINNDSDIVIKLWNESFPGSSGFEYKYNWLYRNNIYRNAELFFLLHDESKEKVGVQGVSGRMFECDGENISAGLVGDFAVSSKHRTLGPGLKLLKSTMAAGIKKNGFVYSFPNVNAIPVVKRAGYKLHKNIKRYVKINKSGKQFEKYLPHLLSSVAALFFDVFVYVIDYVKYSIYCSAISYEFCKTMPDDVDFLWESSDFKKNHLMQQRNKQYIEWRKEEERKQKIYYFIIRDKLKKIMLGYVAYCFNKDNNSVLIVDFFALDEIKNIKSLLIIFVYKIRHENVSSVSIEYMGSENIGAGVKLAGFSFRDKRPMFYKFNEDVTPVLKKKKWFLTAWDEDAV